MNSGVRRWLDDPQVGNARRYASSKHGDRRRGEVLLVEHLDRVAEVLADNAADLGMDPLAAIAAGYLVYVVTGPESADLLSHINGDTTSGTALRLKRQHGESSAGYFTRLTSNGPIVIALKLAQRIAELEHQVIEEPYPEDWSHIDNMRRPGQLTSMWRRHDRAMNRR